VIGVVVASLAITEAAAPLSGVRGGIEGLFLDWSAGAMSYATALQFLLAAYCLAALAEPRIWSASAFSACATSGLLLSLVAIVGHAFDADGMSEILHHRLFPARRAARRQGRR
jgi:hypothetical protein